MDTTFDRDSYHEMSVPLHKDKSTPLRSVLSNAATGHSLAPILATNHAPQTAHPAPPPLAISASTGSLTDTVATESPTEISPRMSNQDPLINNTQPSLAAMRSYTTSALPSKNQKLEQNTSTSLHTEENTTLEQATSSTELDHIDVQELTSNLKRHSTSRTHREERDAADTQPLGSAIRRHHTMGHSREEKTKQSQHRQPSLSEDFLKELQARRKAFRRLSRMDDDKEVLVGTRVDKNHSNYVLMYNMLTGIRIAVSRVSAKNDRDLKDEDFKASHKLVFNVTGAELTPGSKYDFKFKDYAPWVFRHLRREFGIDPADYLISLTAKYILSELVSSGKSGSFFYYTSDYRFIIKTIHHTEHKYLRKVLHQYYEHVKNNRDTLLCRYYGLHRVKSSHGRKKHFVVMGNVFPPNKDIHETFDLKGSLVGRFLKESEKGKPNCVYKDRDFLNKKKTIQLGPQKRAKFIHQLLLDVKLLVRMNVMDYSLLIGIHDMVRGNKDNIRDSTLHMFKPQTKRAERRATMLNRPQSRVQVYRKAIAETSPEKLDSSQLPDNLHNEHEHSVFYSEEGGFQATDEQDCATQTLYYMGVIDILTPYNTKKKSEHMIRSLTNNKHEISAVNPVEYGNRFMKFMANILEHHDDIPRTFQTGDNLH